MIAHANSGFDIISDHIRSYHIIASHIISDQIRSYEIRSDQIRSDQIILDQIISDQTNVSVRLWGCAARRRLTSRLSARCTSNNVIHKELQELKKLKELDEKHWKETCARVRWRR